MSSEAGSRVFIDIKNDITSNTIEMILYKITCTLSIDENIENVIVMLT